MWLHVMAVVAIVTLPMACGDGDDSAPSTTVAYSRCDELAAQQGIDGQLMFATNDALGLGCSLIESGTGAVVIVRQSPDGVVTTERPDDQSSADD